MVSTRGCVSPLMRIGFTFNHNGGWTGGQNYLFNLINSLCTHEPASAKPILFAGEDCNSSDFDRFRNIDGLDIIQTNLLNAKRRSWSLAKSIILGKDRAIKDLFLRNSVDVIFESAQFNGAKLGIPAVAWVPDLQHRVLPSMFTLYGYYKRELGLRAQFFGGRVVMFSSDDSRLAAEKFYPALKGRTKKVPFAVQSNANIDQQDIDRIRAKYGLPEKFFFMPNQFWKHKNHLLVVEALRRLKQDGIEIVVFAPGNQHDPRNPGHISKIRNAIVDGGLESQFLMPGLIPYCDLSPLALASTALLNPSSFEGWSTTVEEGRSLGVQMLLSDINVHQEQMGDQANYFSARDPNELASELVSMRSLPKTEVMHRFNDARKKSRTRTAAFTEKFVRCCSYAIDQNKEQYQRSNWPK